MTVSYQPWRTGDRYPYWLIPLSTDAGPDDTTGVTVSGFSLIFRTTGGVDTTGTGTFSSYQAYPASVVYKPSAADVASAFTGSIIVVAPFPPSSGAADTTSYDGIPFTITAR